MRTLAVLLLVPSFGAFGANTLACYEEPGTRKTTCIDEGAVSANGDTRAAPVYTGGPKGVKKTSFTFVTNCAKGIATLQDRDGVNFGGNFASATPASRSLSKWVCEVPKPRKDAKLRQF